MKRHILAVAVAALSLAGCATAGRPQPEVVRRYAYREFAPDRSPTPSVEITVFALPIPPKPATQTGITDLAGEAQAELVKALAEDTNGPQPLTQAMGLPIGGEASAPGFRDLTRVSRRLVFSLENRSLEPANRVSLARIHVRTLGDVRFVSWDRVANRFDTVDLGKLTFGQTRGSTAELGLGATVGGVSLSPKVTSSAENTLTEELALRQRVAALTGALSDRQAVLLQQGGLSTDLTGNTTADIDFALPRSHDARVWLAAVSMKNGAPDCQQRPVFRQQTLRIPRSDSVAVSVALEYVLRHVGRGHETITEGDDSVSFLMGEHSIPAVVVIRDEELRVSAYQVRLGTGALAIDEGSTAGPVTLELASFGDAAALLRWLRTCGARPGDGRLSISGRRLRPSDLASLYVWLQGLNWRPS